ncbi:MAG: DUF1800 domain-containing protein [Opitutaceae bacterium]
MTASLTPQDAWQPLPSTQWNAESARHLLRRTGWAAEAADVERAVSEGLPAALDRLFPQDPPLLQKPRLVERFEQSAMSMQRELAGTAGEERLRKQRELQERARAAIQELSIKWLQHAAQPDNAAVAKWVLFLSDVYVVSAEKVRNAAVVHQHFDILARNGFGPAPALTKAVSRSPAMVIYLDLVQSQIKAPNENFARELFELFVLGEGNYTENDIKEAARAFTGYRTRPGGGFRLDPRQQDRREKKIFSATGDFTGDDVIELAYSQPAASTFLPREMAKFYLSETPLPAAHLAVLAREWRANGFELRPLLKQFFGSRLFFAPEFRGNLIKSPIQFYLGCVLDMQLDIAPIPRLTLVPLRQMGQALFHPPNVRGWVGGRQWINSATLTARRQFVESLFVPIEEKNLNADEQIEIVAARSNGVTRFTVPDEPFTPLAALEPGAAAVELTGSLLPGTTTATICENLQQFIATGPSDQRQRLRRLRRAVVTLMQSPEYQLC